MAKSKHPRFSLYQRNINPHQSLWIHHAWYAFSLLKTSSRCRIRVPVLGGGVYKAMEFVTWKFHDNDYDEIDVKTIRKTVQRCQCLDAGKEDPQLREHAPISVHSDLGVKPCRANIRIEAQKRKAQRKWYYKSLPFRASDHEQ